MPKTLSGRPAARPIRKETFNMSTSDTPASTDASQLIAGFEKAFSELEAIVERLESSPLSLDETLAEYERGVRRLRDCQRALDAADARLAELQSNPDALVDMAPAATTDPLTDASPGTGASPKPNTTTAGRSSGHNAPPVTDDLPF